MMQYVPITGDNCTTWYLGTPAWANRSGRDEGETEMDRIILKNQDMETVDVIDIDDGKFPSVYFVHVPPGCHISRTSPRFTKREFRPVASGPNLLDGIDTIYLERL